MITIRRYKWLKLDCKEGGHPILLSHCLSSFEVEELLQQEELDEIGVKVLSAEMFSVFNDQMKTETSFTIDLKQIFKDKKVLFFGPEQPEEIKGVSEVITITN